MFTILFEERIQENNALEGQRMEERRGMNEKEKYKCGRIAKLEDKIRNDYS